MMIITRTIKYFFLALNLIMLISSAFSQDTDDYYNEEYPRNTDHVYNKNIKSVMIYKSGWKLSYPIMHLNGNDSLRLCFDDLDLEIKDYSYSIEHCNADWSESGLAVSEYIDGMIENRIVDFEHSFNTFVSYIHYSLYLPNEDIKITKSGNYIIKVFKDYNQDSIVLSRRFFVTEDMAVINAKVRRASDPSRSESGQQIDFTVNKGGLKIRDPFHELKVVISQNYRFDNAVKNIVPNIVREDELVYDYNPETIFEGGSEYRYFDIKSLRYQSERIQAITFEKPYHYVELVSDEPRNFTVYFFNQDLNGKFFHEIQEGEDNDTEPDYVWVHFSMPYEAPMIDGNFYVFGALSDWNYNESNRMNYNFEKKQYEANLLLKQGYYNYEYVFVKDGTTVADNTFLEGSHYETENDYLIFLYQRGFSDRYDHLVGINIINSNRDR